MAINIDTSKQNSRADNRIFICVLLALRLCIRLLDNGYIELLHID